MRIPTKPPQWKSERHNRYFGALYHATPGWLSADQLRAIRDIHKEAKRLRRDGFRVEVDHVVPLLSPAVCGLNVPWNLRIIPKKTNNAKGNRYWPDMAGEVRDLFATGSGVCEARETVQAFQMGLGL